MQVIPHPPPISAQITHRQRMRFVVVTTPQVGFAVTFADLLDTILVARTTSAGSDLFDHVRVNFVEIWASPAIGGSSLVGVEFSGTTLGAIGDGRVISDNSMGIEPAHIMARPQAKSQASQWQPSSGNTCFLVTAPVGAVIDVDLSFRTVTSIAPLAAQAALSGAVAGEIYYRGLDGLAAAGTVFQAQSPATQ